MGKLGEDRNSSIREYFVDLQNIRTRYLPTGLFRIKDLIRKKLSAKMITEDEKTMRESLSPKKHRKSPSKKSKFTKSNSSVEVGEIIDKPVCRSWYAEFLAKYFHDGVCICEKRNPSTQRKLPRYSVAEEPKIYSIGLNGSAAKPANDLSTSRSIESLRNSLAVLREDDEADNHESDAFRRKLSRRTFYQENLAFSKTHRDKRSSRGAESFNERRKIREREELSYSKTEHKVRRGMRVKIAKAPLISAQFRGNQTCICTHRHRRRRKQDKIQCTEKEISDNSIEKHKKAAGIKTSRRGKTSVQSAGKSKKLKKPQTVKECISNQDVTKFDSTNETLCERPKVIVDGSVEKSADVEECEEIREPTSTLSERHLSKLPPNSKDCDSSEDSDDVWYEAMIYSRHSIASQNGAMILDDDTEEEEEAQMGNFGKKLHDSLELMREREFLSDTTLDLSTGSFLDSFPGESSRTSTGVFKSREQIVKEKIVETEILGNIKRRIDKDIDHSLDSDEEDIVNSCAQVPRSAHFPRNSFGGSSRRKSEITFDHFYSSNESSSSASPSASNQANSTFIKGHCLPLKELDTMDFSTGTNEILKTLEDDFTQVPDVRNTDFPFISISSFNEPEDKYSTDINADILSSSSCMNQGVSEITLTGKRPARLNRSRINTFSLPLIASRGKRYKINEERDVYGHELNFTDFASLAAGDQRRSQIFNSRFNYSPELAGDQEKVNSLSAYPSMQDFNIEGHSPSPAANHRRDSFAFRNSIKRSKGIREKDTPTLFYSTTRLEDSKKSKYRSSVVGRQSSGNSRDAKTFLFRRFLSMNVLSVPVRHDFDGNRGAESTAVTRNRENSQFEEFAGQVSAPLAYHCNEIFVGEAANNPSECNGEAMEYIDGNEERIENTNSRPSRVSSNNVRSVESMARQQNNRSAKFRRSSENSLNDFHSSEDFVGQGKIQEENAKEVARRSAIVSQNSLPVCDFHTDNASSVESMDRLVNLAVGKFTERLILFERKIRGRWKEMREKRKSRKFTQAKRSASRSSSASPFSFDMPRISPHSSDEETSVASESSPSSVSDSEVEIPREKAETLD